jgi:hypothetical protein
VPTINEAIQPMTPPTTNQIRMFILPLLGRVRIRSASHDANRPVRRLCRQPKR